MKLKRRRETSRFTRKEILLALNNALVAARSPEGTKELSEKDSRVLRAYTQALVAPCIEHVRDGLLEPEELVFVLTAAATYASLSKRGKRHDYFTSCLPFAQKGTAAAIGIGGLAPITGLGIAPAIGGVVAGCV